MTETRDHPHDDIALTGEYALHLLDATSRAAFEARLTAEPPLRALLREWNEGFVSWGEEFVSVTPPARVKSAIDARLFGPDKSRFTLRTMFGARLGYLTLAAVAAIAIFAGPQIFNIPSTPQFVAEIAGTDRALVVSAAFDPKTAELQINRTSGAAATGRSLELWLIAEGADVPVSLGVLSDTQIATLSVPADLRALMIGGTLAISDEPLGGSPTGAPTGAVLAAGQITPA